MKSVLTKTYDNVLLNGDSATYDLWTGTGDLSTGEGRVAKTSLDGGEIGGYIGLWWEYSEETGKPTVTDYDGAYQLSPPTVQFIRDAGLVLTDEFI